MASFSTETVKNHIITPNFTKDEVDRVCKAADEGIKNMIENALSDDNNSDGNPWRFLFENKDLELKVYNSETTGCTIKKFKAVCIIHYPARHVQEFMLNHEHRLTWDRNICSLTSLPVFQEEKKKVVILRCATKKVGPIAGRDFLDATAIIECDDGTFACGGGGIDIGFPSKIGNFVRGYNHPGGGWHFQPIDEGRKTKVTYIIQSDLKGWFPPVVINNVLGGSYVDFFTDVKKALNSYN